MILVLMGVSGSGKTTIGSLLAERMGLPFADADDYHTLAGKQKMAAGIPLTDEEREPWLRVLNGLLLKWEAERTGGVIACSALKKKYRVTLEAGIPGSDIKLIFLDGPKQVIAERLAHPAPRVHEPGPSGEPAGDPGGAGGCDPHCEQPSGRDGGWRDSEQHFTGEESFGR